MKHKSKYILCMCGIYLDFQLVGLVYFEIWNINQNISFVCMWNIPWRRAGQTWQLRRQAPSLRSLCSLHHWLSDGENYDIFWWNCLLFFIVRRGWWNIISIFCYITTCLNLAQKTCRHFWWCPLVVGRELDAEGWVRLKLQVGGSWTTTKGTHRVGC